MPTTLTRVLPEDVWWYGVVPFLEFEDVLGSHRTLWVYPRPHTESATVLPWLREISRAAGEVLRAPL